MKVLAIIPARSASKRLPGKNTKLLAGKPLIQWTIEAALGSKCIDQVMVSTDDEQVIRIANSFGEIAPFKRPSDLSTDIASSSSVVLHALDFAEKTGSIFDFVALLQPTSSLRTSSHIDEAFSQLVMLGGESLVSVCECEKSPLWCATISEAGHLVFPDPISSIAQRGQDLPDYYGLNGAIYLISTTMLRSKETLIADEVCVPYIMPREESVDIDTPYDFLVASVLKEFQNSAIEEATKQSLKTS